MSFTIHAATVAPALIELKGERGTTLEQSFSIINTESIEKIYFLSIMKFVPKEESGSPQFIPFDVDHSGLPEWIQFPAEGVAVPSRSKLDVPFSVSIPSDVASGGYYAAILVSEAPTEIVETNGAYLEAKVAILLFLEVGGDNVRKMALLDFTSDTAGGVRSSLAGTYKFRVQNQGNVHFIPIGTLKWFDIFGRKIAEVLVNQQAGRILPGSTRTFTEQVEMKNKDFIFAIGPVTTSLDLTYEGSSGQFDPEARLTFWYFPWQLWLLIVGMGALIFCVIFTFIKQKIR